MNKLLYFSIILTSFFASQTCFAQLDTIGLSFANTQYLSQGSNWVSVPYISAYDFGRTNDFTIEMRVRMDGYQDYPTLIFLNVTPAKAIWISYYQSKVFSVRIADYYYDFSNILLNDNTCHHLAIS